MAFFAKGKMIAAAAVLSLLTGVAQAAQCGDSAAGFEQWKADFANEARAAGVKSKGLAALAGARYASATIRADRAVKKAFSGSVESFMQRRGGNVIISKGRSLKKSNAALFNKIESTLRRVARRAARHLGHGDRLRRLHGQAEHGLGHRDARL